MAICNQCGSPLKPGAKFCAVCGTRNLAGAGPLPPLPASPGGAPLASQLPAPASAPPMAAALLVNANGQQQVAITDQMLVGRDPACDLYADVEDVSRRHATVVALAGGWAVKDLGSRNGTFVNDQPVVTITAIYHKDYIRFGATAEYALYDPAHLRPAGAGAVLPATTTITPPATVQIAPGSSAAIPARHLWPKPPDAEGYVLSLRGPVAVERGDKMGKALLAIGLGLINPVLAFIPFAVGKNQILVTLLRLDDLDKGRQVAVTIVGDARSIIDDGDLIAVWGRVEQGTVFAVHIYNYTTDAMSQVIK